MSSNKFSSKKNQHSSVNNSDAARYAQPRNSSQGKRPVTHFASTADFSKRIPLKRPKEMGKLYKGEL